MEKEQSKVPAWYQEFLRKEQLFREVTYPAMSWEEKVQHWVGSIQDMMRSLSGSGGDAYEGFNPLAYAEWKASEPRIDEILALLPEKLQDFDLARMQRGIQG